MNKGQKKEINRLLTVVFSGVLSAVLFAFFMIHHFGPSGNYIGKNALLSPERIIDMQFNDYNPKTGGSSRFVFDKITFSFYKPTDNTWKRGQATLDQYNRFYQLISGDTSIEPDESQMTLFHNVHMGSLVLTIKTESDASWQAVTKIFQEVQFVPDGNHYRIQLREDVKESIGSQWAYFYHPQIYKEFLNAIDQP